MEVEFLKQEINERGAISNFLNKKKKTKLSRKFDLCEKEKLKDTDLCVIYLYQRYRK